MSNPIHQSQPPQATIDQIIGLYNQGQLEQTVSIGESLATQYPDAIILYDLLGASYMGLKNAEKTIASYQKALRLNPNHTDAYNNMGMALYDQGRFDEAVESYQKAVKLEPDFADAHYNLANALKQTGDLQQAIESYKKSLAINPNDAEVLLEFGNALKSYGDFNQAIEVYAKALKINPSFAVAKTNMDNAVKEKSEIDKLVTNYAEITKFEVGSAQTFRFTGAIFNARGYPDAAINNYKQALKLKPDYADVYYNMGKILQTKGELDAAIDSYKKALRLNSSFSVVYAALGEIVREEKQTDNKIKSDLNKFLFSLLDDMSSGEHIWELSKLSKLCHGDSLKPYILKKVMAGKKIFEVMDPKSIIAPWIKKGWKPKVSIFCPTYNHQETIGKTLSSIFEQVFNQPFEIIVTDDASTDETFDVLNNWKKQFPDHVKIIKFKENLYSKGRRTIEVFFHIKKGQYCAACDGDDFWLDPQKLEIQTETLENNPDMMSCTHGFKVYTLKTDKSFTTDGGSTTFEDALSIKARKRTFLNHTLMFRNNFGRASMPPEWFLCRTGDQVLTSFLGNFGGNIHIPNLIGSVYVRNPFSRWSPLTKYERAIEMSKSAYAVCKMNIRMQNDDVIPSLLNTCERMNINISSEDELKIIADFENGFKRAQQFSIKDFEFDIL